MTPRPKDVVAGLLVLGVTALWFYQELTTGVPVDFAVKSIVMVFVVASGIVLFGAGVMRGAMGMAEKMGVTRKDTPTDTEE